MHHQNGGGRTEFDGEVAVRNGVERILGNSFEAEQACGVLAVDRIGRAGQSGGTKRAAVDATTKVKHALTITLKHFDISQHVVTEGHGLGDLHVGEARHDEAGVLLGLMHHDFLKVFEAGDDHVDFAAQIQTDVGGHLVVAGATGVQTLAGVADESRQTSLNIEMHVFELKLPFEGAGGDFLTDLSHAATDVGEVLFGDHANLGEHGRMSQRAVDVSHGHALVKVDAGRIAKHKSVHGFREAAGPGLLLGMQRIVGVVVFLRHCLSLFSYKKRRESPTRHCTVLADAAHCTQRVRRPSGNPDDEKSSPLNRTDRPAVFFLLHFFFFRVEFDFYPGCSAVW